MSSLSRTQSWYSGRIEVVTTDLELTVLSYGEWDIERFETFWKGWDPLLSAPHHGWFYEYMGCGNHLFVKESYYRIFKRIPVTADEDGDENLFRNWLYRILSSIIVYENQLSSRYNLQRFLDAQEHIMQ